MEMKLLVLVSDRADVISFTGKLVSHFFNNRRRDFELKPNSITLASSELAPNQLA